MLNRWEELYRIGIVPVVVLNDAENAVPLAQALKRAGILTAEITFRTSAAAEAIRRIHTQVPDMLVGAGTVTSIALAKQAMEAGASYIVSPGLNPKVVAFCQENDMPILPGVATPTEIESAMELGLSELKFFPAENIGGRNMLAALASPYRQIRFVPTGGISLSNLNSYLELPNVLACGGSWMCPPSLIDAQQFDEIEKLCRQAVSHMHGFTLAHIGINSENADEAHANASALSKLFQVSLTETPMAFFSGSMVEVVKSPFMGEHGHVAIDVNNIDRAVAYFKARGYTFRTEGCARDDKGIVAIYFEQEIGGFALHLRRKQG